MKSVDWVIGKVKSYLYIKKSISEMEWIDLDVQGEQSKNIYEQLFNIKIQNKDYINKQKNLALLSVPGSYNEFTRGKSKQALRTNVNKSIKEEYTCRSFKGEEYIDDIMEINLSSCERGGREMEERYTDRKQVEKFLSTQPTMFGTFTKEGKLIAYIQLLQVNSMLVTNKILGHNDYLNNGGMYYIVAQLVKEAIENKKNITHIMYAHYLVGRSHAGYTYFKERSGFEGINVRFHLHYAK